MMAGAVAGDDRIHVREAAGLAATGPVRRAQRFERRDQGGPVPEGGGDCRDAAGQAGGQDEAGR